MSHYRSKTPRLNHSTFCILPSLLFFLLVFLFLASVVTVGCGEKQRETVPRTPSTRPVLLVRERWYTLRMHAEWKYTYSDKKTTINLFSMEEVKEHRTTVQATALLPNKRDSVKLVEGMFQRHIRELNPNATFTTQQYPLGEVLATESASDSISFRGQDGYHFRYITVPSGKGHFLLSIGIYQPDNRHQEEIEGLLKSLQLLDGSPLPSLPKSLKGLKQIKPLPSSDY